MAEEDAVHKRALRRCRTQLVEDLDFESIIDHLISKEVFPMTCIRNMKDEKYSSDRTRVLLESIETADPSVYKIFLTGLRETKQDHLRTLLLKEKNKIKSEKPQKIGEPPTEKSAEGAESRSKLVEMKADTNVTDTPVVRPKTNVQIPIAILQEPSVGGKRVAPNKCPSDVADGPTPVFDELRDPRDDRVEKSKTASSDLNQNNFNAQILTQRADADVSTQVMTNESTEGPNYESGQVPDGDSCKPYLSLGNLTSYADIRPESISEPILSVIKEQHYNREREESRRIQPQSRNNQQIANNPVSSGDTLGERSSRSSGRQNGNGSLPTPAMPSNHNAPSSQLNTSPAANALADQLADLDTSEEHMFLEEVFDACVIYTQKCRNHADEIVRFIESLPEDYKVCYYDDDLHFGLFPPDSQPEVLNEHCILHLIVISDSLEDDKDTNYIRKTITMLNKNNAKVRSVLFTEEDEKFIPKSMANIRKITWYNWHDKGKEHLKANFDALLLQCKALRKRKESQNVRTKKHVD